MSQIKKLTGAGMAPLQALGVIGDEDNGTGSGITATGSTQVTAYPIGAVNSLLTTVAASTGTILPIAGAPGEELRIMNFGANTVNVYPPVGGRINFASINAAATVASGSIGLFISIRDTNGAFTGLNYANK